uniref:Vinorine synthase-like n=1 Tax=Tanacetum cinerariifolium TaxID=118510 RepID=A0A699KIG8_TANCI|nr:hypothetical protein [Tanacetum cinerariifolium]
MKAASFVPSYLFMRVDVRMKLVPKLPQTTVGNATKNYKSALSVLECEDVARRAYCISSFCGFPFYKADFGWGNPDGCNNLSKNIGHPFIVLMDTPDGDGIEALVSLVKEDMEIFEKDKEMLSFAK